MCSQEGVIIQYANPKEKVKLRKNSFSKHIQIKRYTDFFYISKIDGINSPGLKSSLSNFQTQKSVYYNVKNIGFYKEILIGKRLKEPNN